MLSLAENRRALSKPRRRHPRISQTDGSLQRYSTESTAFPVALRADVENVALREEGIGKGAAIREYLGEYKRLDVLSDGETLAR